MSRGPAGVRELAVRCLEVPADRAANLAREFALAERKLEPRDRRLLRQLVYGTLRWRLRLDWVLAQAANRPIYEIDQRLLAPLRVAAFQLLFLDRVPAYAAVSEAVGQARSRAPSAAAFVNAVLRRISRSPQLDKWPLTTSDPLRRLAIETSHPRFLVKRWVAQLGEEAALRVLEANNRPSGMHLLAFSDRGGRDTLAERLAGEGVTTRTLELSPFALRVEDGNALETEAYRAGDFYIQDQASQVVAGVPPLEPGEKVFDAAAAPGGKSFAILAADPDARLIAADLSPSRLATLAENCRRLGRSFPLLASDAAAPALAGEFDRVLADLPCSGTGILCRNPDLKWRLTPDEIGRLAGQALELLEGLADRVRSGGRLIAITCSIEPEENEAVVDRFLERRPDFELEELPDEMKNRAVRPGLLRILPGTDNDGFTVQLLRRR